MFAFGNLRATARSRYARQTPSLSGLTRICALRELRTQNSCHKYRYSVALLLTNPLSSTITAARLFAQRSALLAERLLFLPASVLRAAKIFRSLRVAFCKQNCRLFSHFRSRVILRSYSRVHSFQRSKCNISRFFVLGNSRATARSRYARQTPSLSGLTRICALRELRTQNSCHKYRYSVALLLTNPLSSTITAARLFAQRSALLAERLLFLPASVLRAAKIFRSLRAAFCKQNCRLFSHFRSACYSAFVLTRYIPFNAQYATLLVFVCLREFAKARIGAN